MKLQYDELIKKWEELRLKAYLPTPNDEWTIGWGHTAGVQPGDVITREQAQIFFERDVAWAEEAVNSLVRVGLTQHQFDALVSLVFNIGTTQFQSSTLLRKLNAGDYDGAANEFPRWKYQEGKVLRGLVRRRAEEMEYFLEPDDVAQTASVKPDEVKTLKPLVQSKEVWAGVGAAATGVGTLLGGLTPSAQIILAVAAVGIGLFFIYNRVKARNKGER
ncbi:MAG: lysozyme [Sandaracinus sp.]|nr:lysozyme [Sandaracinus sp.]